MTSDETLNVNDIVETVNHFRSIDLIIDFHVRFEKIHPFQDGNGRVGRLVMFKECLRSGVVPFIITDELKMFYYRGLREWGHIDGYLTDTCLTAQDQYKAQSQEPKVDGRRERQVPVRKWRGAEAEIV